MDEKRLSRVLNPKSIAIIGASNDLAKVGGRVVHLLRRGTFPGPVFPVNPRREEVQGLRCYPSIKAITEPVDLCIVAVTASDVQTQVQECLDAGARGLIVLSSGYAEHGVEGIQRQAELAELVERYDVPMIGPNCLGVMNGNNGLVASSTFSINDRELLGGKLSFVTQSGAIGTYWLDMVLAAGLGVANWLSTGNEANVDLAQVLEYLVDDERTAVIGLYVEGIRNGALFRDAALRALVKKKPILVLKAGRSSIGATAAASHTGTLAGEDALYQTYFEQYGICRVESLTEMLDLSRILVMQPAQSGRRTCVVSVSGGAGVLITDAAISNGLEVPAFSPAVKGLLTTMLPHFATAQNPLDVTAQIATDPDLLGKVLRVLVESGEFDRLVIFCGALGNLQQQLAENMIRGIAHWECPSIVIWQANRPLAMQLLADAGIPVFAEIPPAVAALARATRIAAHWMKFQPAPPMPSTPPPPAPTATAIRLTENASKTYLNSRAGLDRPRGVMVSSSTEVFGSIRSLRGPFAVKLQSPHLMHKSGSGGISLNLSSAAEVTQAVADMLKLAESRQMESEGVLIEEMQPVQFEFLVGLRTDPALGSFLVVGRGGVDVEVDPDVARAFLPVTQEEVLAMFSRLRASPLYSGFRGRPAAPLAGLARVVCALAALFQREGSIQEIEINPLGCDDRGAVVALDASVLLAN